MIRALALLLLLCAQQEKKPKGQDGPGDPERRKKFLEGESAADARALVETNNPAHLDAVGEFFRDVRKPFKERLAVLKALRLLREQDEDEYKRVHAAVRAMLSTEASRGLGMGALGTDEEEMLLQSMYWHADVKYDHARFVLEMYVDPEVSFSRAAKLPDRVREVSARLLAAYPPQNSSREALWAALCERREADGLRQACYESLKSFDKELKERILALKPSARDRWLPKLQERLREEK